MFPSLRGEWSVAHGIRKGHSLHRGRVRGWLLDERAHVVITDPRALENARRDLAGVEGEVTFEEDPYAAAKGAHALAVVTEWDLYRTLDYVRIIRDRVNPAFIFDGRNILEHEKLHEIGFNVCAIGKAPLRHFE